MNSKKSLTNIAGWFVFTFAMIVYFMTAERTGSLWDCGEFITGAYKLQVVHPPGAALFLLIGRIFTLIPEMLFPDNPEMIAFSINLLSGACSAFAATFVCWTTMILGKMGLVGREGEPDNAQMYALMGAGIVAGLSTAFCTSIWFSAVEGEVYAMSTFFTALTMWSMMKWYNLPDEQDSDRWLVFTVYAAGLSIGVHLLSILTFPALAMFYFHKKKPNIGWLNLMGMIVFIIGALVLTFAVLLGVGGGVTGIFIKILLVALGGYGIYNFNQSLPETKNHFFGTIGSGVLGVLFIGIIQTLIIVGIPTLWSQMELLTVNTFGMPFFSGTVPMVLIVFAVIALGLRYASRIKNASLQYLILSVGLVALGFSTIGVVVIRANANTPINMNDPSDPMRLIPYLNREQYGERPLLRGPHFDADPDASDVVDRYGQLGDRYEIVDQKVSYKFDNSDKMLFPRIGHYEMGRDKLHRRWMGLDEGAKLPGGRPNQFDNMNFLFRYQIGWMYWRYFMWNFSGRQNGEQGYEPWDKSSGHWISGITPIDNARLDFDQSALTDRMKDHKARNKYYMLPFLFGLLGFFWHANKRGWDFLGLLALFVITGIGIIIYSNQPPNEPRERDYVLVGSFFTYCIWIGMGVLALFQIFRQRFNLGNMAGPAASALVMIAPLLMLTQNFDDHDRSDHSGSRDYANNFLESCAPNSIIFTYGDNDTYPLWYAQEVEKIRTDVRVVNLSLIAVDWYIDQLKRKVNDSPAIKFTIPAAQIRGKKRNQMVHYTPNGQPEDPEWEVKRLLKFMGSDNQIGGSGRTFESFMPTRKFYFDVNKQAALNSGAITQRDTNVVSKIPIHLKGKRHLLKGDVAVLDIIASNLWERPIYFAVTCRQESMLGLQPYTQLEGLGLRIVPIKSKGEAAQYGMMGNGRVNTDAVYNNFMTKYKWGGFDGEKSLHVDRSYGPSIQSHRVTVARTSKELIKKGQKKKATELIEKYFTAFPNHNFEFDYHSFFLMSNLIAAEEPEVAKKYMRVLAQNTADQIRFFGEVDKEILTASFETKVAMALRTKENLLQAADKMKDDAFKAELTEFFKGLDF